MRILSLNSDAYGGHGGIAQYCRDVLEAVCEYPSVEEVVTLPRVASKPLERLPEKLRFDPSGLGGVGKYALAVARQAASTCTYDLILCAHVNLLPLAFLVARAHRAKLVLLVYGIEVWRRPPRRRLSTYFVGKVDAIASISQVTLNRMKDWAPIQQIPTFIVPNAIEMSTYTPGPKPAKLLERYGLVGRKILLTVARLPSRERYKGVDEVLELLGSMAAKDPSLAYLVIGDGEDRRRLESKARSLGVADRTVFAGWIPESEKVDHYRLADAFVMPGRGEGFGFVYLEAMACGVPAVASVLDGSREAVREGELGVMVDPTDEDDLRRGILEALARPTGVVPPGLDYFETSRFRRRWHQLLDDVFREGR